MLTVDHFARDEHVSKTGKSACVRIGVWKVGRFNIRWNNKYVVLVLKSDCNLRCRSPNILATQGILDANKDFRPNPGF